MIIKIEDLYLYLQNFAKSYELSEHFTKTVIDYFVGVLEYKIKETGMVIPSGGFVTLVMPKNETLKSVNGILYLQEGMNILFDVFADESGQLQIEFTEEEFHRLLAGLNSSQV